MWVLSKGGLPPPTILPPIIPRLSIQRACLAPERRESLASLPLALVKPNSVLFTQLSWSGLHSSVSTTSLSAPERLGVLEAPGQGQQINIEEVLVAPANCVASTGLGVLLPPLPSSLGPHLTSGWGQWTPKRWTFHYVFASGLEITYEEQMKM